VNRGRRAAAAAAAVVAVVVVGGCADDGPSMTVVRGDPLDEPTGEVVDVQAIDNTFSEDRIVVAPGTMVRWTNAGRNDHDVLSIGGGFGVDKQSFRPGQTYSYVFDTPGEYPYYCELHGLPTVGMIGVVIVQA
jgi:plastocyanin